LPDLDSPSPGTESDGAPNDVTRDDAAGAWPRAGSSVTDVVAPVFARIGRYTILRLLGEGGMGAVYEAEQDLPHRIVALKLIRAGYASPETLRRFENEAQALGRLHHPGIAQIYEAGRAGNQPYFAMELVYGETLLAYSEHHKLSTPQRLELVAKICDAVQHAHQRGLIHRDLKPANILVEESGQPRVLDFGLARLTDSDAHATRQTDIGQLLGTLAYMSPEQVLGDPEEIDTRSDVYALGVILYELLAGQKPYAIGRQLPEVVRTIREEEPTALHSLNRTYRGDIETVVGKALEKDKTRRYASAAELAADLRRHLRDEPITARPPSTTYQLQKFARRNKALVVGVAAVFVVLIAGVVASTWEAVQARRAEASAQAVNDFLQNDLLAQASTANQSGPGAKPDPDLKVRTALDRAAARIGGKFAGHPDVEASIRDTMGQTYTDLGLYPEARKQFEQALDLERRALGEKNPHTLKTMSRLARVAELQGKYPEAEALLSQALAIQRRVLGSDHPDTLYSMVNLLTVYGREGKQVPEALGSETLAVERRVLGPEHPGTLALMNNLANGYQSDGKFAQAEALHSQALEIQRRVLGPEHPDTLRSMGNLANVYEDQGKYAQAEALYSQTIEIQRRVLGAEHPVTLGCMDNLANVYAEEGKYAQSEALHSQTLEIQRRVLGPKHPSTLGSMDNLAGVYEDESKYAQAEALFSRTLEMMRSTLGPEHAITVLTLGDFASMYQREGKYDLAEKYGVQALAGQRRALGAEHPDALACEADLALAYVSQGKFAEAEPLAHEALEAEKKIQPDDWQRYRAASLLGASLAGERKYTEAEPLLLEGYQGMLARKDRIDVPDRYHLDVAHQWLIQLYQAWGKPDKAAEWKTK
jgi:eukaryotic-like serine/threonine-protein kinase